MKRNIAYTILVAGLCWFLTACMLSVSKGNGEAAIAWGCCAALECAIIGLLSYGFEMKEQYDGVCENRDEFASIAKEAVSNSEEALKQCGELIDEERDLMAAIGVLQEYIDEGLYQEINEKLQGKGVLFSDKFTPGEMSLCYRVKKESDV